jgi:hypothetical protein
MFSVAYSLFPRLLAGNRVRLRNLVDFAAGVQQQVKHSRGAGDLERIIVLRGVASAEHAASLCRTLGQIDNVQVPFQRATKGSYFAFVTFAFHWQAEAAVSTLNGFRPAPSKGRIIASRIPVELKTGYDVPTAQRWLNLMPRMA